MKLKALWRQAPLPMIPTPPGLCCPQPIALPLLHDLPVDPRAATHDDDNLVMLREDRSVPLGGEKGDGGSAGRLNKEPMFVQEERARADGLGIAHCARCRGVLRR